jgi:hypothetical protein
MKKVKPISILAAGLFAFASLTQADLVASYSFETVIDGEGDSDLTPNDLGSNHWDLGLPLYSNYTGADGAISVGEGRNGGNALSPNLPPSPGYAVPKATALDTEFDNATAFTLIGWYRGDDIEATNGRLFDRMSNNNQDGFFFRVNSAGLDARLRMGDGATGVNVDTPAGFFISDNTWRFIAVTFNAGDVVFYRGDESTPASVFSSGNNGLASTGVPSSGPFELTIGTQASSPSNALFNGYLDDLKIYNSALTLEEIQAVQDISSGGYGPFDDYVIVDGYADTGDWLGVVYVGNYPWVYVFDLQMYTYATDPAGWVYLPK